MDAFQQATYASEATENFRWISSLIATKSDYVLTSAHLAGGEIQSQISDIGEYAELAHGDISPSFVFENMQELCRPSFPLEGYDALRNDGAHLVKQFAGSVAEVQGYAAFRPHVHQLVVAFSGTSSFSQTLKDLQSWRTTYPLDTKHSSVHSGFWKMYQGVRSHALEALRVGFQEHGCAIQQVVLTGHSMGGTMCYFLAFDLMGEVETVDIPHGIALSITTFGSPRLGNKGLSKYWKTSIDKYRSRFGDESFHEYSVKGYKDGAHTLPPCSLGFRHLTSSPFYFHLGRLYRVPPPECEHGTFTVAGLTLTNPGNSKIPDINQLLTIPSALETRMTWPKGGHNYYFRDMEKLLRRMQWLEINRHGVMKWQDRYMVKLKAWEDKWNREETVC